MASQKSFMYRTGKEEESTPIMEIVMQKEIEGRSREKEIHVHHRGKQEK